MKAVLYEGFGPISVIHEREVPSPALSRRSVRLAVKASGLNRADLVQRRGHYPPPPGETEIPGLEASGIVSDCGPDVTRFRVGDRVMALLPGGGYASEVCVDERCALPIPERYSFAEGAAIMEVFLTAHHNFFTLGEAKAGERALMHAGASGVGTAAIQLLREAHIEAFVTVSSLDKAKACESLGARAFLGRDADFAKEILAATGGQGVNVIVDPVGASYLARNMECVAMDARIVYIGVLGGFDASVNLRALLHKRTRLIGSTIRGLSVERKGDIVARFRDAFYPALEAGRVHPVVDRIYPVGEVREAQQQMEENANVGKIVLTWE